ncbi:hypothetical protein [Methanobrevibacter curvatus]|uniref:Uncharacterized protein n=1 Tax=Methanobrevibacter curvatus TaxID=49547 RepID=A0A165ZD96_9EURY|nr:hypothetical protein [Methanobrevibacter curvatus]KZX10563.1 hypothetical protein MBCUR_17470 [Methanobrevibacter curvatus]
MVDDNILENTSQSSSKPRSPPIPKITKRNHVIIGAVLSVVSVILCIVLLVSIITLAGVATNGYGYENIDFISSGGSVTVDGEKINIPTGFEATNSSTSDKIYLTKGEDHITVYSVNDDSAKDYAGEYTSKIKISGLSGGLTIYSSKKVSVPINDINIDNIDFSNVDELENVTYYTQYVFDYNDKVFVIDIDDNIKNHKAIIQEILGI